MEGLALDLGSVLRFGGRRARLDAGYGRDDHY